MTMFLISRRTFHRYLIHSCVLKNSIPLLTDRVLCLSLFIHFFFNYDQFLEEARRHAGQRNPQVPSPYGDEAGKGRSNEEKRSKKSWKNALFSWWKADKKSKPSVEQVQPCSRISDPRRGHVSGPIYGSSSSKRTDSRRQRRPTSGPLLTNLFNPTRRAEADIPYASLNQLNISHGAQAYGPVYLVT